MVKNKKSISAPGVKKLTIKNAASFNDQTANRKQATKNEATAALKTKHDTGKSSAK